MRPDSLAFSTVCGKHGRLKTSGGNRIDSVAQCARWSHFLRKHVALAWSFL